MSELVADLEKVERGMVPDAVAEMMGRSGGFNVPADYFRSARGADGAAMVPGGLLEPRRKNVVMGVVTGGLLLLGVVGATLIVSAVRTETAATTAAPSAAIDPAPEPRVSADPPETVVAKMAVTVTTDPVDATIALDGDTADAPQQQPRTVALGADEKVAIRIERAGYKTLRYVLDPSKVDARNPRVVIRLERDMSRGAPLPAKSLAAPSRPPTAQLKAAPTASASPAPPPAPTLTARPAWCLVEDWDPFSKKCAKH